MMSNGEPSNVATTNSSTVQLKTGTQLAAELRRHNFQFGFREDGGFAGVIKERLLNEQKLRDIYALQKDSDAARLRESRKKLSDRGNLFLGNSDLKLAFEEKRKSRQLQGLSRTQDPAGGKPGGRNQNKVVSVNLSFADPQQFTTTKESFQAPPARPPGKFEHTQTYTTAQFRIGSNSSQSSLGREEQSKSQQELLTEADKQSILRTMKSKRAVCDPGRAERVQHGGGERHAFGAA